MKQINENGLEIVMVPIGDLKPYEENPRVLLDDGYYNLAKKMLEYGWIAPLTANRNEAHKNIVIGGNQRLSIANDLHDKGQIASTGEDFSTVPVVYLDIADDAEIARVSIVLNGHDGKWDKDGLANLLGSFDIKPMEFGDLAGMTIPEIEFNLGATMAELNEAMDREGNSEKVADNYRYCSECGNRILNR